MGNANVSWKRSSPYNNPQLEKKTRIRTVPAGTAMLLRVMVVQDFLPDFAAAAVVKVQVARSASSLAGAAGAALARETVVAKTLRMVLT
jgi:hypothetical protein